MEPFNLQSAKPLAFLSPEQITWVQHQLKRGAYLEKVDGIVGPATLNALKSFKSDFYLEHPELIGNTTLKALSELDPPDKVTEQATEIILTVNAAAGSRTGRSATLPGAGLVYANQWIRPGIPLTWGEMTKDMTRLPTDKTVVANIVNFAAAFGQIRAKFGSPIAITSGYRPKAVNDAIGGASKSQHVPGKAADIRPANGEFDKLLAVLKSIDAVGGIGLGEKAGGFLHADTREKRVIFPYGSR
jgi:hypothetical protein